MERTDLLDALQRAIAVEQEAHTFYLGAADQTDDAGGAAMFRELAAFESHHQEQLEALKASLLEKDAWIRYTPRELGKQPRTAGRTASGPHTDALEALRLAIAAETKAAAEYLNLADQADDARGQQMFQRLAQEEALHRKLLDDQYYALSNSGLWLWGD